MIAAPSGPRPFPLEAPEGRDLCKWSQKSPGKRIYENARQCPRLPQRFAHCALFARLRMKALDLTIDTAILALVIGAADPLPAANLPGLHEFDLRVGRWQAHHRCLKERLAGSDE
jgi:hypothetical protein